MKQLMIIVFLLGVVATDGGEKKDILVPPARLANGMPIEGTILETNTQGLVILTPRGTNVYSWKYLSAGTCYRHKRFFQATQTNVSSRTSTKTKISARPVKSVTTNIAVQTGTKAPVSH